MKVKIIGLGRGRKGIMNTGLIDKNGIHIRIGDRTKLVLDNG